MSDNNKTYSKNTKYIDIYNWVKDRIISLHSQVKNYPLENDDKQFTGSLGVWSVKKLISLNYYIEPFINIIKGNNFKKCIYVDPFCGSGLFQIDNNVFPGSPLVSLFNQQKFDKYYLSDIDENYVNSLRKRISPRFNTLDIDIKCCDCNARLLEIFDEITSSKWKNSAYLVFLDPYGFHLNGVPLNKF